MADTKLANTNPTPTPAPLILIVANPAPINLADSSAILIVKFCTITPYKSIQLKLLVSIQVIDVNRILERVYNSHLQAQLSTNLSKSSKSTNHQIIL